MAGIGAMMMVCFLGSADPSEDEPILRAADNGRERCAMENDDKWNVRPLANDFVIVCKSPDPQQVFCGTPGLARLPNGRLMATMDMFGPGAADLPEPKGFRHDKKTYHKGNVFTSDDHGGTWAHRLDYPFLHARPFVAGQSIYVLGHCSDLMIVRSDNEGKTWSKPVYLTKGQEWTGAAGNVLYANGCIYLVMEKRLNRGVKGWRVADIAPVLMRGKLNADLTKSENWTFASDLVFEDICKYEELNYFGVPFFIMHPKEYSYPAPGRECAPMGWLEANVAQITDPNHYWCDPEGKTFHLWMRAHTGGTGYAAIAKVVEKGHEPGAGPMTTMLEKVPSGKTVLFVPCPGGQMKFYILDDKKTRLYWLLSTQATDSMTRADRLPSDRYNLPNNERRRLQLHFSKNMMDWCFAGLVAIGQVEKASRHYASMVIDGEDLRVLSRSGDAMASSAHNGNLITLHTIRNFRELVY